MTGTFYLFRFLPQEPGPGFTPSTQRAKACTSVTCHHPYNCQELCVMWYESHPRFLREQLTPCRGNGAGGNQASE